MHYLNFFYIPIDTLLINDFAPKQMSAALKKIQK